jgi:hypothetical protein
MSHHDHDAGLVHEHGWACSDNATHAAPNAGGTDGMFHSHRRFVGGGHGEDQHGYDDGLVHDHSWARD